MDVVDWSAWEEMMTRIPNTCSPAYEARYFLRSFDRQVKAINERKAQASAGHPPQDADEPLAKRPAQRD